ncbi:MAG: VOC family protein [Gemmatimonadetes bacterium]|nr:VOC family protein [Gemmatimonadota bacterium]
MSLQVSELERSLAYYQGVLGFRLQERDGGRALLAAGESDTALLELSERAGARPVAKRGHLGLYHFAILVPDREALGRFAAHLPRVGERSGASDHLVSEALYLRDPDGLGIEVYADRPRSTWRHEGRQLVMATEPLNLGGLVRAAGGEEWSGLPEGTVIGHVHLHVGDIGRASDFFHKAVGFDQVVWSYPGALFLSAGGYHHHLGVNTWAGADAAPPADDEARLLFWEIVLPGVDDVEAATSSLVAAGYDVAGEEGARSVSDPWGTELRLRTR